MAIGLFDSQDLTQRVATLNIDAISSRVDEWMQAHNESYNALINIFAERTTAVKEVYYPITVTRAQPLDEHGRPLPIKPGKGYDVAYPLKSSGSSWGANWVASQKMTLGDIQRTLNMIEVADKTWMRDQLFAALFDNTGYTFNDPEFGSLSIKGLANNDSQVYPTVGGGAVTSSAYHGQASAIGDANNPFPAIFAELRGFNGGSVIAFISTSLRSSVQGLTDFIARDNETIIPSTIATRAANVPVAVPGEFLGVTNGCFVVELPSLPVGYIVAVSTEGDRPLKLREESIPSLQGLVRSGQDKPAAEAPFYQDDYYRKAGFGAWNRVGASVYLIGNGTYSAPTGYSAPLP